ncbi:MAG: hypothetical protein WBC04_23390 [Candidatus Acidiferrales bacterium]
MSEPKITAFAKFQGRDTISRHEITDALIEALKQMTPEARRELGQNLWMKISPKA